VPDIAVRVAPGPVSETWTPPIGEPPIETIPWIAPD
jgi:hypothetical protein